MKTLVIFDIDATLIAPNYYNDAQAVKRGLYDPAVLTSFLANPNIQVALASFNQDIFAGQTGSLGGRRLGRAILDIQMPSGDSRGIVEDIFIQAWRPTDYEMSVHGKNVHINLILEAFRRKYRSPPRATILYDDCIENVYLAARNGIQAYWVTEGLTRANMHAHIQITGRFKFRALDGQIGQCMINSGVKRYARYLYKHPQIPSQIPNQIPSQTPGPTPQQTPSQFQGQSQSQTLYSLFLPPEPEASDILRGFLELIKMCGIEIIAKDCKHG